MKLVMTLLVRDCEELLRPNLEFHLRQGVDFFIITDNGSVDGTGAIIEDYVRLGLAERIYEPEDTFRQSCWVTRMARRAAIRHGADWIINSDDDEFWCANNGDLGAVLQRVPAEWDAVQVQRFNHPPLEGMRDARFLETMVFRERDSRNALGKALPPKVCHRALGDIEVAQGNHFVAVGGARLASLPASEIGISHFPLHGYVAFERRIAQGGAAYLRNPDRDPSLGRTWKWLYGLLEHGELRTWYDGNVLDQQALDRGLATNSLVLDEVVVRTLGLAREDACSPAAA